MQKLVENWNIGTNGKFPFGAKPVNIDNSSGDNVSKPFVRVAFRIF